MRILFKERTTREKDEWGIPVSVPDTIYCDISQYGEII